jgi:hypothetical protein
VTLAIYPNGSLPGSRSPVATVVTRTDSAGAFDVQVVGLASTRYDFVAKPAGALSRELNGISVSRGAAETLAFTAFGEGDVDGDDDVDGADAAVVLGAFSRAAGESGYDARADLDRDGTVSLLDVSLLARSFGVAGPVQEP